eukprot:COSAG06_NODE_63617_length_262_cov_0.306748_1_plen_47_part_10
MRCCCRTRRGRDRKSVEKGKSVRRGVDLGGRRTIKKAGVICVRVAVI